jgi:hypothetical protein
MLDEVEGTCGAWPEFGKKRTFRLRGMKLTLEIKDFAVDPERRAGDRRKPAFTSLRMAVTVEADPSAASAIAAAPGLKEPVQRDQRTGELIRDCKTAPKKD